MINLIGKTINLNGKWIWVELTPEEINDVIEKTIEINNNILKKLSDTNIFDKIGVNSFTVMKYALEKKIYNMRNK